MTDSRPKTTGRQRGSSRRRLALALAMSGSVLAACGSGGGGGGTPTLSWYVFPEPSGSFADAAERCSDESGGRYRVEIADLPASADVQREQLVRRLAAEDSAIDIMYMDVIWTAEFAEAGWLLPWEGENRRVASEGVLEGPLQTATYNDQLWTIPMTSNTQLLWYRKDRISEDQVPETWEELITTAEGLGENNLIQEQGARYEGLTVWFNSLLASAGGDVIEGAGEEAEVAVGGEPTQRALEVLRRFATSEVADPSLSTNMEDQGRLAFQNGESTFMLNWPYVYPSAEEGAPEVFEQMAWARYPAVIEGEPSRPPLGGANLGVGAYTRYPELAFEAASCIASAENQRIYATAGGLPPTYEAVYDDPDVRAEYPFADILKESINDAAPRPVSPAYNDISRAIYTTIHPLESINVQGDAEALRDKVEQAINSEGLL